MSPTSPRGTGREPGPEDSSRESWQRRQRQTARGPRHPDDEPGPRDPGPRDGGHRRPGDPDAFDWPGSRESGPRESGPRDRGPRDPGPRDTGFRESGPGYREPGPRGADPGFRDAGPRDRNRDAGPRERDPGFRDEPPYPPAGRGDRPRGEGPRGDRPERGQAGNGRAEWRPDDDGREPGPRSGRPRLRRPHRRRAVAGQQTGLDPDLQSDLPTWLQQRGIETAPVRRLLSLSVASFSALLGFGLLLGAYTLPSSYSFVIFGVQCLFVLAWTVAMRPPGALVVGIVGVIAAGAADFAAVAPSDASLAPLGYVMVGGFVLGVIGQLLRGAGRDGVTESLGATLAAVVGAVAFASLLVLNRHQLGTQSIVACLAAAAVALVVSRLSDIVLTTPRTSPEVARGAVGVVLGAMAGTAAAAVVGSQLVGLHPTRTAIAGLVTAMAAIMADLAVSYAEVSRELDGDPSSLWVARHMQGPLGGFALAAPAAYVLSVMVLVPGF